MIFDPNYKEVDIKGYEGLLFGYLNPYYRSAYNIPKRRK